MRYAALAIAMALMLSGCATTASVVKPPPDYRIGIKDELRVVIWKQLDEKVTVRPDGRISLPMAGEVYCKGKTPRALSEELSAKYELKVTVIVAKAHTIQDDLKELLGFLRDVSFFYFLTKRVAED